MKVENYLRRVIKRDGAAHLTLIDPAKQSPGEAAYIVSEADRAGTDGIMVGGSTGAFGRLLDDTILEIKKVTDLPVILFPASERGISRYADAIFFMSMLNSQDPYFITGAQVRGAPIVRKFGLESIPMGYLVVEPGGTVGKVGKAKLIPRNDWQLAANYAIVAEYLGMRFFYLEAGSGADKPVPVGMVKAVKKATNLVLIVGGGIKTPEMAAERVAAGADIIVTGTLVEKAADVFSVLSSLIRATKAAR
ncbi:MAG: geranylgeranylglyceryl/heptaprenylglyceryl phosphate synthase [Candidatus Hadarchaeales archaeon]